MRARPRPKQAGEVPEDQIYPPEDQTTELKRTGPGIGIHRAVKPSPSSTSSAPLPVVGLKFGTNY